MSSRSYCITSFENDLKCDMNQCRYIIIGKETCPETGRKHLQCYAEFYNKIGIKSAKKIIGDDKAHLEKRMGTREEARSYCMKEQDFEEFGDWNAGGQGVRNDLRDLVNKIESGKTDAEFLREEPEVIFKYAKFIDKTRKILEEEKSQNYLKEFAKNFVPNVIQTEILKKLEEQTERQVLWVCDKVGGNGKTWLSKYLVSQGAERFTNGKTADIAYAIKGKNTVIFDFSRSLQDRVNYDIIEAVKNGMVFSSKYESGSKIFKPPKIAIFANFEPDLGKLSMDRWQVWNIPPPQLVGAPCFAKPQSALDPPRGPNVQ